MSTPSCASWAVWVGKEVEGRAGRDKVTLFVRRSFDPVGNVADRRLVGAYERVWFCADYFANQSNGWGAIYYCIGAGKDVAVEVTSDMFAILPVDVRSAATIYYVLPIGLKSTDYVKFGAPYSQTVVPLRDIVDSFVDYLTTPGCYANDVCLKK